MNLDNWKADLEKELDRLKQEENQIDSELGRYFGMIAGRNSGKTNSYDLDIKNSLQKIETYEPVLEAMQQDSKKLVVQIEDCRGLSDRLSSMVRRLDNIQIRAQQALACTEDIMNLKDCKVKLAAAIEEGNLSLAVSFIRQVHEIDLKAVKTSEDFGILTEKEKEVKDLVQKAFEKAINDSDITQVMSLCPLLQTLGLETEARDSFLSFIEKNIFIAVSADASSVDGATDPSTGYIQALSNIFNSTYLIIQQYLPMVIQGLENSLGDVFFIRKLHKKCEVEAGMILKRYMKFRSVRELIGKIKSSADNKHGVSPADIHIIMDELAVLIQCCCRYSKYIKHVCKGAEQKVRAISAVTSAPAAAVTVFSGPTDFDQMVVELVNKYYMEGEQWLMRNGIRGAFAGIFDKTADIRLDECFFVLQKCGLRAIGSNNIHAACAVLHFIADMLSSDLLGQVNEVLNAAAGKIAATMVDHMEHYKRSISGSAGSTAADGANSLLLQSTTLSKGFKDAFSLASTITGGASTAAGSSKEKKGEIVLFEDGGFVLSNSDAEDPWGAGSYVESFNMVELCIRYTERLGKEIVSAGQSVFEDLGADNQQKSSISSKNKGKSGSANASEIDKLLLCKEDFDVAKLSFSNALQLALENLASSANGAMKDVITAIFAKTGPLSGLKFDEVSENFLKQPSVALLPKILTLPMETILHVCTHNMSDKNKDIMVEHLAEACCERLEHFITQTSFQLTGALKYDEIVRTLITIFGKFSTKARDKFSRLRGVMSVLTVENQYSVQIVKETVGVLTISEVEAFLGLRTDLSTSFQ